MDRFEIGFHDIDGRVQQIMRRPVAPQPVESSMIEQYIEARLDWVRRFEGEEAVPRYRASLEADQYSEHLPFYSRAFVDSENRLWLGSSEWPVDDASRVWSIFAREGHWLGELEASEGLEILDASTDRVLAIWRDSLDVPHVQTHRLLVTDRLDR